MSFSKIFVAALLSIITLSLQYFRLIQIKQGSRHVLPLEERQDVEVMRVKAISRSPALGFENLLADGVFLSFLQYFGDSEQRQEFGYGLAPIYFEGLIDRDPRFIEAYLYLSNTISLRLGRPDQAIALMEKGLASLTPTTPPRAYYIWRFKAIDELLFLGDGEAAKKSFEKAAEWARQSSDEEAPLIAEISSQTAQFLAENPVSRSAQISAWAQVLVSARDEETEQIATEKIEALGGTVVVNEGGQVSVNFNIYDE
ncbi:hypothetical protein IQ260_01895 [Leptolyngbya cf. ectocarpi LEGE 11479]|uniref:Tetratricopeptide repeat protein n=1 Tax=Leptolyngbya cf. ectocarpi LEGE 11479 TaxID=1828722 RepID=A0A928ZTG8_LEPEC|nr:hypothetical protein [Leptolyngbya ectocarpi]MBE9065399.1 hypothetical protein [Leptolyngbya cf. ectocarpi LEGE 11479]